MRIVLIIVLLLEVCLLAGAPVLSPEERNFDFGQIYEKDGVVNHTFKFRNTGDEPLLLIEVKTS